MSEQKNKDSIGVRQINGKTLTIYHNINSKNIKLSRLSYAKINLLYQSVIIQYQTRSEIILYSMVDQNYQTDVEKCIKQIRMVYIHNRGVFASQKSFCKSLRVQLSFL
ncbi:unnamed protein product [Paramecium pentaurelia]|uniref:Uncharacterized protein n=1 Tax=Paramecium pentaurelia TaxID=43138 RepID=A0A8S1VLA6_9CILI|nr:unnamed protein product [Paramecium pentaurelia]